VGEAAVVLLGHGSRDASGAAGFLAVAQAVQAALTGLPVDAGVLEFAGPVAPSIAAAFARAVAGGARRILAVPVLLHFGEHGTRDMPSEVAAARARHAGVEIRLAQPLTGHEHLLDLVAERCAAAEAVLTAPPRPCAFLTATRSRPGMPSVVSSAGWQADEHAGTETSGTTVLLVGRGSTIARANADLYATARLFQERGPYATVEVCFVSLAAPCVPAGLRRCVALGARRVLVVPYFVNTGLLVRRIASQIAAARLFYPAARVAVAAHFGPDPRLIAALVDRARTAWPELVADGTRWSTQSRLDRHRSSSSRSSSVGTGS
jgi:sirohydrochlorin cobaltochelatase